MKKFILYILPFAKHCEKKYNINKLFIMSVAALETGWGKKIVGNNYFNIKASKSWQGKTVDFRTHEYVKSNRITITDKFRAYDEVIESFEDFCELIKRIYPQCVGIYDKGVCRLLVSGKLKYATAPYYTEVLTKVYDKVSEMVL